MGEFVGLDVSLKETAVCILNGSGGVVWRGRCLSDPGSMAAMIEQRAPMAERVVLESGPLSTWHWHGLKERGVPVICVDARSAKAALSGRINKSDELDAEGLAQLARTGWYNEVRVKSLDSHRIRSVLVSRARLVNIKRTLSNTIRGLMKAVGLLACRASHRGFADEVRSLIAAEPVLGAGIEALLVAWEAISRQIRTLDRLLSQTARHDPICRKVLMTAPGVGVLTALAFKSIVDDPSRFRRGAEVAAYLGLVPRRSQSGEMDHMGRISRCGDSMLRGYLFEAATVALSRVRRTNPLTTWARNLAKRAGQGKARVALARKLAVILFTMWRTDQPFRWQSEEAFALST
jgi:transposase